MRKKKISIKDIAKEVGVSIALVSYVLNGLEKEKRVSQEIVQKIHAAAKELNYQPNQIARSLRRGATNTIGLIVADISNPFFGQLARVIEDEAAKYNYTVIFGSSDESCSKSASLIEALLNRQVDGFIISPSENCVDQISNLVSKDFPVVLVDRYFPELEVNYVALDNFQATYSAVNMLIAKGYKKIKLIAYKSSLIHMKERVRGYVEAMQKAGLQKELSIKEIRYSQISSDMGKTIDVIVEDNASEALVFATNALTLSGLYALKRNNVEVPGKLAVVGFDGHEAFDFFQPPLTYIKQPLEEMGKESVKILIEQIQGSKKIAHITLKPNVVMRTSCR